MTGTLARSSNHKSDVVTSGSDSLVPLSSRELFWRARYLREGEAAGHLPLLFWLTADLRPRRSVTLQVESGILHFGLCQAIDKVGYDAVCYGFGSWPDKEPSGKVPEAIASYNASEYEDISRLRVGTPQDVQHHFNANSLDLLIVESGVTAGLLRTLAEHWLPKMSDKGVVVLCGTADTDMETSIQLADLRSTCAHVHFDHSGGLDIILAGIKTSDRLSRLVDLDKDETAQMAVHRIFARLGSMHLNEWAARDKTNWARGLNAAFDEIKTEAKALQAERDEMAERLDALNRAYDQRQSRTATLEQMLADRDAADAQGQAALAQLQEDLSVQKAALARERLQAPETLLSMTQAVETAKSDLLVARNALMASEKALQQSTEERTRVLVTLTAELEALQAARAQEKKKLQEQATYAEKLRRMIHAHEKTIQRQAQKIADLEKDQKAHINLREEMQSSTSWRITAPLRRARHIFDKD